MRKSKRLNEKTREKERDFFTTVLPICSNPKIKKIVISISSQEAKKCKRKREQEKERERKKRNREKRGRKGNGTEGNYKNS